MPITKLIPLTLILACAASAQTPAGGMHWVATWTTAQQIVRPEILYAGTQNPAPAAAPQPRPARFPRVIETMNNQTVRMIARTSVGGRGVRIQLSNAFGDKPAEIGAAHIALRTKDSAIVKSLDRAVTFGRRAGVIIAPGAVVVSDPVADFDVPPLADLAVSL